MDPSIVTYRELYYPSPGPGTARWLTPAYMGKGLERAEILSTSTGSDAYRDWQRRVSSDNGATWSAPEPIKDVVVETPAGGIVTYPSHPIYDPHTGRSYRFFMRRQWPGKPCYTYDWQTGRHPMVDHVFVSEDGGAEQLLRYEDGADFDPSHPFDPAYLDSNHAYMGNAPAFAPDGTVYFPINLAEYEKVGVILFRRDPVSSRWLPSNRPRRTMRAVWTARVAAARTGGPS